MNFTTKKASFLILIITSLLCSRASFLFINDPEGPNLLIVVGMAVIIYFTSLTISSFSPWIHHKRIFFAILIQVLIATSFAVLAK